MKVLIVCSGNKHNFNFEVHRAFISDQVISIEKLNSKIKFYYFFIKGKGISGYLKNLNRLTVFLKNEKIDIIHAHYSFSGLLSNLQRKVPVVCTFHGSDINVFRYRFISVLVQLLSKKTIFVSEQLYKKAFVKSNSIIIPCGVDTAIFKPMVKEEMREYFKLDHSVFYILFSSFFTNPVKNYMLLQESIKLLNDKNIVVLELENYTRFEVAKLMNAVDICVLTSFSEGSPQFIKEAIACGCPVVSVDVGDVKEIIASIKGCYLTTYEPTEIAEAIRNVFKNNIRVNGREGILQKELDSNLVANKIKEIYFKILSQTKCAE